MFFCGVLEHDVLTGQVAEVRIERHHGEGLLPVVQVNGLPAVDSDGSITADQRAAVIAQLVGSELFFEVISRAYERTSLIVT